MTPKSKTRSPLAVPKLLTIKLMSIKKRKNNPKIFLIKRWLKSSYCKLVRQVNSYTYSILSRLWNASTTATCSLTKTRIRHLNLWNKEPKKMNNLTARDFALICIRAKSSYLRTNTFTHSYLTSKSCSQARCHLWSAHISTACQSWISLFQRRHLWRYRSRLSLPSKKIRPPASSPAQQAPKKKKKIKKMSQRLLPQKTRSQ